MKCLGNLLVSAIWMICALASSAALAVDCNEPKTDICLSDGSNAPAVPVLIQYGRFGPPQTGQTEMKINPPTKAVVRALNQNRFEITLKALGSDPSFKDKVVTIESAGNPWLSGSATANDAKPQIKICIPAACPAGGSEYKYDVTVEDVGNLDPRVKVED